MQSRGQKIKDPQGFHRMNKKEIILKLQAPLIEAGNSMGKFKGCERERHNRGENISVSFVS